MFWPQYNTCSSALLKVAHRFSNSNVFVAVFPLQEEAGSLLVDLSSSLNFISVNQDDGDDGEVVQAATPIVEAASNILNVSSNVRTKLSLPLLSICFFSLSVLYGLYQTRYNMFFFRKKSQIFFSLG